MSELIAAVVGGIVGAVMGSIGTLVVTHFQRKQVVAGHFNAISAEVDIWRHLAAGYLGDTVLAPSYRVPLIATERSLPALLAEGELKPDQTETLLLFLVNARSINLGLDLAQQAVNDGDTERKIVESRRLRSKCENAIPNAAGNSLYDKTVAVLGEHIDGYRGRLIESLPIEKA